MAATTLLSDNGVTSGITGYQLTGGNDGTLQLQTTTAGGTATTAMTIDASQNVGIGTSSPAVKLTIKQTDEFKGLSIINAYNANEWGLLVDGSNSLRFSYNAGGLNAGEKMRIDSSGNLLVGTTSTTPGYVNTTTGATLNPNGSSCFSRSGADFTMVVNNNTGSTYNLITFRASGSYVGQITSNGTTTSYTSGSDYRLKENIQPMQGALATVAQLKPCTYTWKADGSSGQGFIAHELQEVVPECVVGEKDAVDEKGDPKYQGIDTSFLVATLTAAIQEQQALITTLTERITALENK